MCYAGGMFDTLITLALMGASGFVGYKLGEGGTKFKMNPAYEGVTLTEAQRDALLNLANVDAAGRGRTRPTRAVSRATEKKLLSLGLVENYNWKPTQAGLELVRVIIETDRAELRAAGWNV